MSFSGIGQLATDVVEVVQVDECDIVDQCGWGATDEVALEQQAPAPVGIVDRPCASKAFGEVRPKRAVVARRDLRHTAMRSECLGDGEVAADARAMQ